MKDNKYYTELEQKGYYETIDKRSKDYREYKQWKAKQTSEDYNKLKENVEKQSKGLGDTIEKITTATGIKKAVKFIAGEDCGCDERKEKLNKVFTYKNVNCISEEDYNYLISFFDKKTNKVNHKEKVKLIDTYNFIFNQNESTRTSCSTCIARVVRNLKKYLELYK